MAIQRRKIPRNSHASLYDKEIFSALWLNHTNYEVQEILGVGQTAIDNAIKRNGLSGLKKLKGYKCSKGWRKYIPEGQKKFDRKGYIWIYIKDRGWQAEHRMIAEQILERPLLKDEVVHHLNEIKFDNRPANLLVLSLREHAAKHSYRTCRDCPLKKNLEELRLRLNLTN